MEFGPKDFEEIIRSALDQGYVFLRFDRNVEDSTSRSRMYLRHDVDISPRMALRLGEVAAKNRIVSNLFFQLNSETYTIFSRETLDYVQRLREMGHCVGLHIDGSLIGSGEDAIARTIEWFNACCGPIDPVVSFHRPDARVLGKIYRKFVNAYAPPFFDRDHYLSDSRRSRAFWPKLQEWLAQRRSPIQLLLHPEWWHPTSSPAMLWDQVRQRRIRELERYMTTHFRRVFEGVLDPGPDKFEV